MLDAIYGIGIAIDEKYKYANGFELFKRDLIEFLKSDLDTQHKQEKTAFTWRDGFIALANRTKSKQLTITDEELINARSTNNGMIIDNGKWTIIAGEFGITEHINGDMMNGND